MATGFTDEQIQELKTIIKESNSDIGDSLSKTIERYLQEEEDSSNSEDYEVSRDRVHRDAQGRFLSDEEYERLRDDYYNELAEEDPYYDYDEEYMMNDYDDDDYGYEDDEGGFYSPETGFIPQDVLDDIEATPMRELMETAYELRAEAGLDDDSYEDDYEDDYDDEEMYADDYDDYDDDDDYESSALDAIQRRYEEKMRRREEINELRIQQLEEELEQRQLAEEEEYEAHLADRAEKELAKALDRVGVVSLEAGIKWFGDKVVYDEDSDEILYDKEGEYVPLTEGLKGEVPRWLKAPKGRGGAGTQREYDRVEDGETADEYLQPAPPPDPDGPEGQLAMIGKQLEAAKANALSTNNEGDIVRYQVLSSKYNRLKSQVHPESTNMAPSIAGANEPVTQPPLGYGTDNVLRGNEDR